ncbi:hypothetical protein BJ138DRAFT_1019720 [Hygrophoropsis aurantiaca]|uniref:Uncharacterized protein n=1 Tax=Hygrophoropsis aurantiaca TaxID=72124 RepID=A0ACB7ZSW5_9AGAM|nr:hypothetical protein BJ138DRAFT_1019720 [Hygrophoropsis aurantiaca]
MPQVPDRVQRHFPPLVMPHSSFGPERLLSPPSLTISTELSPDTGEPALPAVTARDAAPGNTSTLIPKPRGEVSRLSRHGYTLLIALGWAPELYEEAQSYLHGLASKHLDLSLTLPNQKKKQLSIAREHYPMLANYDGDWATKDFLQCYLKNTRARGR